MTKSLERSPLKVPGSACARDFSKTLSVHPAVNGHLTLCGAGDGEGSTRRLASSHFPTRPL